MRTKENSAARQYPPRAKAVAFVRNMRGGSHSVLLEADDGSHYVVKFKDNPQHRRVLVNEWIATGLLRSMSILTPIPALIEVTQDFLDANPCIYFREGTRRRFPAAGVHFGSQYPGSPERVEVYDFLPAILLRKLRNQSDFVGALIADLWMSNADPRQAVFLRCCKNDGEVLSPFMAFMIDNGYCLGGAEWDLKRKVAPLHWDRTVYEPCWSEETVEFWLARVEQIQESSIWKLTATVPPDWLEGDREALDALVEQLIRKRRRALEWIEKQIVKLGLLPSLRTRKIPVGRALHTSSSRISGQTAPNGLGLKRRGPIGEARLDEQTAGLLARA
jgi:hypothetical protein